MDKTYKTESLRTFGYTVEILHCDHIDEETLLNSRGQGDLGIIRCAGCMQNFLMNPDEGYQGRFDVSEGAKASDVLQEFIREYNFPIQLYNPSDQPYDLAFRQIGGYKLGGEGRQCFGTFFMVREINGQEVWVQPGDRALDYRFQPGDIRYVLGRMNFVDPYQNPIIFSMDVVVS